MEFDHCIVPAPQGSAGFEEVTLTSPRTASGSVWKKHILNLGTLIHPQTGEKLALGDDFYDKLRRNFEAQVCDTVAVPLASDSNKHVEDPLRNAGEVIGLERDGNKVYAVMDIRNPQVEQGLRDRTILGSSAFLHMNYTDTRSGAKVGPTLLHNCLTNRAYCVDLDPFEEIIAATQEGLDEADNQGDVELLLTEDEPKMDLAELKATLLAEHGIDVDALQQAAAQGSNTGELVSALTQALTQNGTLQLTGGVTGEDLVGAVAELAQLSRGQGEEIGQLKRERAEGLVDKYIGAGRLLPKARDEAVELVLTNPAKLDAWLAPEDAPYVKLAVQEGVSPRDSDYSSHTEDVEGEIARLTSPEGKTGHMFATNGSPKRG